MRLEVKPTSDDHVGLAKNCVWFVGTRWSCWKTGLRDTGTKVLLLSVWIFNRCLEKHTLATIFSSNYVPLVLKGLVLLCALIWRREHLALREGPTSESDAKTISNVSRCVTMSSVFFKNANAPV